MFYLHLDSLITRHVIDIGEPYIYYKSGIIKMVHWNNDVSYLLNFQDDKLHIIYY